MALTDLTRISTAGIATGTSLSGAILHGDAHFRGTNAGINSAIFDSSENELNLKDNVKLTFGDVTNGDLRIYHDTSNGSYIREAGPGALRIQGDAGIWMQSTGNQDRITADNNAVNLFSGGTKRFNTTSTGAVVTGVLTATSFSGPLVGNTNNTSGLSTFYDLRVSNNLTVEGTTTTLDTNLIGVDRVEILTDSNTLAGIAVTQAGTADLVRLFDGATRVVTIDGDGRVGLAQTNPLEALHLGDNQKIALGWGQDLEIFFNGTNSVINNTEGALLFQNNGSSSMYIGSTGQVYLNNDITFVGASANALWDKSENYFSIPDSIVHSGDTDTKIRFPSADTIQFETGGSNKLSIGSSITSTTAITIYNADPELTFRDSNHSPFYYSFKAVGGAFNLSDSVNGDRMRFSANGSTSVVAPTFVMTGAAQVSTNLGVTGNLILSDQIIHDGDTNTKIRFPAADTFSVETAGSERLNLTASRLSLATNIRVNDYISHQSNDSLGVKFYNASGNNKYIGFGAEDDGTSTAHQTFKIYRQGSAVTRLSLDSSGNLKFDGADFIINDAIEHNHDPNTRIRFPADDQVSIETAGSQRFRIDSSGNVGIDETGTILGKLHVVGGRASGTAYNAAVFAGGQNSTSGSGVKLYLSGCENSPINRGVIFESIMTDNANAHRFSILVSGSSAAPTERFRITPSGVHFYGNQSNLPNGIFGFRYDKNNDTDLSIENLNNSSVNNNAGIRLATNHSNIKLRYFNNGGFYIQNASSAGYLHYYEGGESRLYIDTSGNVNINNQGTIATSNGGVGKRLGIKSNANNVIIGETESASNFGLILESRVSGRSGDARSSQIGLGNEVIDFYTAPSGSGVIKRMEINSSGDVEVSDGNLVIGTSGHGIDFSATANSTGTTQSELLDDYEEGYFAPTVRNLSSGYASGTFYNRQARYTKVGNMVTCWVHLQWWANATTTDNSGNAGGDNLELTIEGFPFEVDGVGYSGSGGGGLQAQSWRFSGSGFNNYAVTSDNVQPRINSNEEIRFGVFAHNSITGQVTQKSINGYNPNIEFCFTVRVTSYK